MESSSVLSAGGRVAVLEILLPAEAALEVAVARLACQIAESGELLLLLCNRGDRASALKDTYERDMRETFCRMYCASALCSLAFQAPS